MYQLLPTPKNSLQATVGKAFKRAYLLFNFLLLQVADMPP